MATKKQGTVESTIPDDVTVETHEGLTGEDTHLVDVPDEDVTYAPEQPSFTPEDYPLGAFIGIGVEQAVVGDLGEFKVDPSTGRVTGRV